MEAVGIAAAALDHPVGVHARRDAYQNAFLNAPQRFNPLPFQVDLKLVVHHVRSQKQSDLPQFRKLPLTVVRSSFTPGLPRSRHISGGASTTSISSAILT